MLIINHLGVLYGKKTALRDVSLSVEPGMIMALVGPNGAGKTSLIRAVSGTVRPVFGTVTIDGNDISSMPPAQRARLMAVVPQARQLGGAYTVRQAVMMGRTAYMGWLGSASKRDEEAVTRALEGSRLTHLAQRHIANLSGGEQQRVLLARALAQETKVLLLDEPTNHLDLRHQTDLLRLIRNLVKEKGLAVLFAMHDLNLVSAIADQVALIVDGHVKMLGSPREVLTAQTISAAYGVRVSVVQHPDSGNQVIFPEDFSARE
jgi:iron complex transport system ATP-binding protein